MARAKRTDRTEARRRYRAEQVALTEDAVDAEGAPVAGGDKASRSKAAAQTAPAAARPSIVAAFRGSFQEVHLKDDLRSLPRILTHWGFLAALGAAVAATAVFILSTNDLAVEPRPLALPARGGQDAGRRLEHLLHRGEPVRRPAARGRRLPGRLHGPARGLARRPHLRPGRGRLLQRDPAQPDGPPVRRLRNDPQPYIANAWIVGPIGAMFFAAASAWYKRFLNLANPNRGKKPEKAAPKGRGNAKPNSRAASRP